MSEKLLRVHQKFSQLKNKLISPQDLNLSIPIFIRRFTNNKFIKVSGANGIITIAKAFLIIISNKVVALIVGTSGIAMLGQLQSFISIITQLSSGGFNKGLIKYIAENKSDKKEINEYISTSFIALFTLSSFTGLLILIFSKTISLKIFSTSAYVTILMAFAVTLFFYNLNNLIFAIVNGFQSYRQYFKISITITLIGFLLTITLVFFFKEYGALMAIVLSQSIVCLFSYIYIKKDYWVKALSIHFFNKDKVLLLLKFGFIMITTGIAWPIVTLIIRTYIINNISQKEAGLWQAICYINDYIVVFTTGSFSVYLLPKLSSITEKDSLKKELINIYKVIIPITLIGFMFTYLLRIYIIQILYSREFIEASKYLLLQMVGSFFWMCKSPLQNFMFAKDMLKIFFISEIVFALLYVILTMILIPLFKVQGVQLSFAITMFCYFITSTVLINRFLIRMND